MAVLAGLVWKVCGALVVLLVVAWALGVLPGAVRLFAVRLVWLAG